MPRPILPFRPMSAEKLAKFKTISDMVDKDYIDTGSMKKILAAFNFGIKKVRTDSDKKTAAVHTRIDNVLERVSEAIHIAIANRPEREEIQELLQPLYDWQEEQGKSTLPSEIGYAMDMIDELAFRMGNVEAAVEDKADIEDEEEEDLEPVVGPSPEHKWEGTKLSFKLPDGSWGEAIDLRGHPGFSTPAEQPFGQTAGVGRVRAGANVTVTSDGNGGVIVSSTGGGSGSGAIIAATDSDDHKNYSLAQAPTTTSYYLIINGGTYTADDTTYGAWSVSGTTLTFSTALPTDVAGSIIKLVCV